MANEDFDRHGTKLLAAILPDRLPFLTSAMLELDLPHFPNPTLRAIFGCMKVYYEATGGVLKADSLVDLLKAQNADPGTIALLSEQYDSLTELLVSDDEYRWALHMLKELQAEEETKRAFVAARQILTDGGQDEQGNDVRGHQAAREYFLSKSTEIERGLSIAKTPEGETRTLAFQVVEKYREAQELKAKGIQRGCMFGIDNLDRATDGMQLGELTLIVGESNGGKSSMAAQAAWWSTVMQGKNVLLLTQESPWDSTFRKLIARHSLLPQFELPDGLDLTALKRAELSEAEFMRFQEVVDDYHNGDYGRLYMARLPYQATIDTAHQMLRKVSQEYGMVDLMVVDYLGTLKPLRKRNSEREELVDTIKASKELAMVANDGAGVALLSPWQINRESQKESQKTGELGRSGTSSTAEATNSSDLIISILKFSEDRKQKLKGQVLKARDGATYSNVPIMVDFGTSSFWSEDEAMGRMGRTTTFSGDTLGGLLG